MEGRMPHQAWHQSGWLLLAAALLFPPAGLVFLWIRRRAGFGAKLFGSLVIAAIGLAHLVQFYGLRWELDGSGSWPIFTFHKPESHYRELERSRSEPAPLPPPPAAVETPPAPAPAPSQPAAYWTDFRGPRRDGRYDETPIRTTWPSRGLPRLWKQPIGGGYASFVVAAGRAFTIEQRRDDEVVAAYDLRTGRELWTSRWKAHFQESLGGPGPRATPTWHEGKVYSLGAEGELRCLDGQTGRLLWSKDILADNGAANINWGMANSPLIVDEKVVVLPGGSPGKSVAAYHKLTGEPVWKVLDDKQSYTSPMLVTLAGRRQILVVSASRAMGLAPEDGKLLWEYPWITQFDINSSQPIVVGGDRFFISAGYGHGAALVHIKPAGDGWVAETVWQNTRMKTKFNSPVLHEGHVYGLDEGILACVEVQTGELKWKGGRYGYGQVLLASGHLVITTETGDVVLVRATPERHDEVARFSALEGKTWNNPAIAGGLLLVRNTTEMACFRIAGL
jgi:outer membrane protein assembly factor BamB